MNQREHHSMKGAPYPCGRCTPPSGDPHQVSRRWFLQQCGVGLGAIALQGLLANETLGAAASADPLAPKAPHFAPRAKNVILLFMGGGPSQFEMWDYKPVLQKHDGQLPPAELLEGYRAAFINPQSKLLGPRYKFAPAGGNGLMVSELLPHTSKVLDDLCVVRSAKTDAFNHAPAQLLMQTGSQQFGRPSFGAWTTYGLGSESRDLPAFVVFNSGKNGPSAGSANWGAGFLPTVHAGVEFRTVGDPVLYLSNPQGVTSELQQSTVNAVNALNRQNLDLMGDAEIATRINSYEMAYRMQASAPEAVGVESEPQHVLDLYGVDPAKPSFSKNCLLARRLVERGVRFVQLFHEAWDQHGDLKKDIVQNCADTDQGCAALVQDLKQRGLLDETLVIWCGEFGRTPMVEGGDDGRDHHPNAFTIWMAGGGVKPGVVYGATDDLGFNVVENPVHVHDLQATLLHLLGFDHKRLTHRFQGRDFRLTDVHGEVVHDLIA